MRNGLPYGWNATNTSNARYRTSGYLGTPPDLRYSTLIQTQANGTFTWQIAVPNGTYDVHLVAGDPSYTDSVDVFNLEGLTALSGSPTAAKPWIESTVRVTVNDGNLSLSNGTGSSNNKIDYIDINSTSQLGFSSCPSTRIGSLSNPSTLLRASRAVLNLPAAGIGTYDSANLTWPSSTIVPAPAFDDLAYPMFHLPEEPQRLSTLLD